MVVLAGDIGGTKASLGLFDGRARLRIRKFASRDYHDLESICSAFLEDRPAAPAAAAFGVAGPIVGGRSETTNLPWVIERESLERLLGCPVAMLNDLESTAHGIPLLDPEELCTVNEGRDVAFAARAIIAAGTGLGEGYMVFDSHEQRYEPRASEGGHCDFAARDAEEIAMLRHLMGKFRRVSVERVVSGPGIAEIFEYLASTGRYDVPREIRREGAGGDPAPAISQAALEGRHPICVETMRRFVSSYGAEAGNLALKVMALGGVYIGGGIAPRILPLMTSGLFMESFRDKGRFAPLMERIPVRIILDDQASLRGAAAAAARLAART